jgi:hypothetical protein
MQLIADEGSVSHQLYTPLYLGIARVNIGHYVLPIYAYLSGFPFAGGAGRFFRGLIE